MVAYFLKPGVSVSTEFVHSSTKSIYNPENSSFKEWDLYKMNKINAAFNFNLTPKRKNDLYFSLGAAYINVTELRSSESYYNNQYNGYTNFEDFKTLGLYYSLSFEHFLNKNIFINYRIFQNIYLSEISTGFSVKIGYKFLY